MGHYKAVWDNMGHFGASWTLWDSIGHIYIYIFVGKNGKGFQQYRHHHDADGHCCYYLAYHDFCFERAVSDLGIV